MHPPRPPSLPAGHIGTRTTPVDGVGTPWQGQRCTRTGRQPSDVCRRTWRAHRLWKGSPNPPATTWVRLRPAPDSPQCSTHACRIVMCSSLGCNSEPLPTFARRHRTRSRRSIPLYAPRTHTHSVVSIPFAAAGLSCTPCEAHTHQASSSVRRCRKSLRSTCGGSDPAGRSHRRCTGWRSRSHTISTRPELCSGSHSRRTGRNRDSQLPPQPAQATQPTQAKQPTQPS